MVFGELVDTFAIFGSRRKVYIFIGATFTAGGLLCLAGAAGGWIFWLRPDQLYSQMVRTLIPHRRNFDREPINHPGGRLAGVRYAPIETKFHSAAK